MGDSSFPLHAAREDEPKAPGEAPVQKSAHRGSGIRSREAALKAIGKDLIKKLQRVAEEGGED
jgi:hypothetical protein